MHLNQGETAEEGGMRVIAHSLPPLLPTFVLAVMKSFMTEQICHFGKNEEEESDERRRERASRPSGTSTASLRHCTHSHASGWADTVGFLRTRSGIKHPVRIKKPSER